jgi:hypothetical protein
LVSHTDNIPSKYHDLILPQTVYSSSGYQEARNLVINILLKKPKEKNYKETKKLIESLRNDVIKYVSNNSIPFHGLKLELVEQKKIMEEVLADLKLTNSTIPLIHSGIIQQNATTQEILSESKRTNEIVIPHLISRIEVLEEKLEGGMQEIISHLDILKHKKSSPLLGPKPLIQIENVESDTGNLSSEAIVNDSKENNQDSKIQEWLKLFDLFASKHSKMKGRTSIKPEQCIPELLSATNSLIDTLQIEAIANDYQIILLEKLFREVNGSRVFNSVSPFNINPSEKRLLTKIRLAALFSWKRLIVECTTELNQLAVPHIMMAAKVEIKSRNTEKAVELFNSFKHLDVFTSLTA